MKTAAAFAALRAELEGDVRELGRIAEQNVRAWERIEKGADDPIDWGALGYTLHHLYGVLENYFRRVSRFFENSLASDRWHRDLIEKMRLDIPAVRPALFCEEDDYRNAVELMRFRHRFRNLYGEDLDPAKTREIQKNAIALVRSFPAVHEAFVRKLEAISEELP